MLLVQLTRNAIYRTLITYTQREMSTMIWTGVFCTHKPSFLMLGHKFADNGLTLILSHLSVCVFPIMTIIGGANYAWFAQRVTYSSCDFQIKANTLRVHFTQWVERYHNPYSFQLVLQSHKLHWYSYVPIDSKNMTVEFFRVYCWQQLLH